MKHLLLIAILLLSLSCKAQRVEPLKPVCPQGDMVVMSVVSSTATIRSELTGHAFKVDAQGLREDWEYFFILQVSKDSEGKKVRPAVIKYYSITPRQAQKNINAGISQFKKENPDL